MAKDYLQYLNYTIACNIHTMIRSNNTYIFTTLYILAQIYALFHFSQTSVVNADVTMNWSTEKYKTIKNRNEYIVQIF